VGECDIDLRGVFRLALHDIRRPEAGRQLIGAEKVSFRCPNCGEICFDCAVEKIGLLSKSFRKSCGFKVNLNVVWSPL
jgi:predicted RNA-binding Zn-ribbon protein involved in translation (DUF1610 family)